MTGPLIEFRDVTKIFRSPSGSTTALDGIDLSIEAGEVFAVIGYSGAGKSTVARLINGLERVTSGDLLVGGQNIARLSESGLERKRRDIGMVFQQFNLFRSRTLAGNVGFPLKVAGWSKAARNRRIAELLDFVGLLERAHDYPDQLSGGQKQRIGIARALATNPQVLLADEATSALDPRTTQDVLTLLKQVNREFGVTIVAITHELSVVRSIANRVAVLESGRVAEVGTVFDIFSNPQADVTQRFVGTVIHDRPSDAELDRIRRSHDGLLVTARILDGQKLGGVLAGAGTHGVGFEIVYGGIGSLQDRSFGSLTLELKGPDSGVQVVLRQLRHVTEVQVIS